MSSFTRLVGSPPPPQAAAAQPAQGSQKEDSSSGGLMGTFNPDELERGASALKDIDSSKHSSWAFDLAKMQEQTAQYESLLQAERMKSARSELTSRYEEVKAEEQRKTISHSADQERETAQMKAQIENSLQGRKLDLQREQAEYKLRRENELFQQHEAIRIKNEEELEEVLRETMRQKAKFDRSAAVAGAEQAAKGEALQERENIEVRLRELRAQASEDRRTRLEKIDEVLSSIASGSKALLDDPAKGKNLVLGLTTLAVGVYSARQATRVAATVLERHLGRPPLVRETSRWTWRPKQFLGSLFKTDTPKIMDQIVLEENLKERLQWSTNALISAQENGTPFRHLMLHGAPGTGKTLFARTLARQSGLDYAVMSGGDLGPLGREGPHEIHKLFDWAKRSKSGMVLFIDEADAFLRKGRGGDMSEDARNALSVFLHHTGTENARVAIILATNVPGILDRAVIDRVDEAFEFTKPAYDQRKEMLSMFLDTYIRRPTKRGAMIEVDEEINSPTFLEKLAKDTEGFSGRQLAKLVLAFQAAVFGSGSQRLTRGLADTVLQWRMTHASA
eukprot:TRINITY_DN82884_c0_g1_i1.p1 TRINITY_DN82884_c0_g1~~TRINITY_DN82884_c0_g1_i1.p1  ORF type:complete len:564 (-),score=183.47 TRINITY_DN82884_c0_g1_i1:151-1842(-)